MKGWKDLLLDLVLMMFSLVILTVSALCLLLLYCCRPPLTRINQGLPGNKKPELLKDEDELACKTA